MPRTSVCLTIDDISAFSRRLRADLQRSPVLPTHLGLMNMLARAAGHANFQHLKSTEPVDGALAQVSVAPAPAVPDPRMVALVSRCFDATGRMVRWPAKTAVQGLCLWVFWARMPARQDLSEREVNAALDGWHGFADRALLRRSLIDHGLFSRTEDGRLYRRIEVAPSATAAALIKAWAKAH